MSDVEAGVGLEVIETDDGTKYRLTFVNDDNYADSVDVTNYVEPNASGGVNGGFVLMLTFGPEDFKRNDERRPKCDHPRWPTPDSPYCASSLSCPNYAGKFIRGAR